MLWSWLAEMVLSLMTSVLGLLPSSYTSPFGTGTCATGGACAVTVASHAGGLSEILPMGLIVNVMFVVVCIVAPAVLAYEVAQWGYRELPHIAGFGS